MSDILESMYGTDGTEALEKAAQAKFIEKLASEYEVDVSDLDAEQLEMLEQAVVADLEEQGQLEKEAGEEVETEEVEVGEVHELTEEDLEKQAAAYDAFGRVMAHGFMEELEKTAGDEEEYIYVDDDGNEYSAAEVEEMEKEAMGIPAWLSKLTGQAAAKGGAALKSLKGAAKGTKLRAGLTEMKRGAKHKTTAQAKSQMKSGLKRFGRGALESGGLYGGGAAALGGGAMLMRGKKKNASALDALADDRAMEILGLFGEGHEKVAADEELDDAVTVHAFEKLAEAGYPVEEMIEALQDAE